MKARHQHKKPILPLQSRGRGILKKGSFNRRIIASGVEPDLVNGEEIKREFVLHATKGFRAYRA